MARTLNGNFVGRAARIEYCELLEKIREDYAKRQEKIAQGAELFRATLDELRLTDPNWEAWYDDDNNIPVHLEWLNIEPVITNIRQRIHEITITRTGAVL